MITRIDRIPLALASPFIKEHHYSHGHHGGPSPCVGAFDANDRLVGVCMFATPCSENVRAKPFGWEERDRVTELHRLALLDECPRNSESTMISASLRILLSYKPQIRCVVSFADPTQGHLGTIYQATNFLYTGRSGRATFYLDSDGRLRHPRQNGVNITSEDALRLGWTPTQRDGKMRYIMVIAPDRRERRFWQERLSFSSLPYPKVIA